MRRDAAIRSQPSLFDLPSAPPPLARKSDPETSQQAANHATAKLSSSQSIFIGVLRSAVGPLTASEIGSIAAKTCGANSETIRKRAKELLDAGRIRLAGTKICGVTRQNAQAYLVVL